MHTPKPNHIPSDPNGSTPSAVDKDELAASLHAKDVMIAQLQSELARANERNEAYESFFKNVVSRAEYDQRDERCKELEARVEALRQYPVAHEPDWREVHAEIVADCTDDKQISDDLIDRFEKFQRAMGDVNAIVKAGGLTESVIETLKQMLDFGYEIMAGFVAADEELAAAHQLWKREAAEGAWLRDGGD